MKKIIRFTASWCGPCKVYAPIFQSVASQNPGIIFETVDVDSNPDKARDYNVRSVPTTVVVEGGKTIAFKTGMVTELELKRLVAITY